MCVCVCVKIVEGKIKGVKFSYKFGTSFKTSCIRPLFLSERKAFFTFLLKANPYDCNFVREGGSFLLCKTTSIKTDVISVLYAKNCILILCNNCMLYGLLVVEY